MYSKYYYGINFIKNVHLAFYLQTYPLEVLKRFLIRDDSSLDLCLHQLNKHFRLALTISRKYTLNILRKFLNNFPFIHWSSLFEKIFHFWMIWMHLKGHHTQVNLSTNGVWISELNPNTNTSILKRYAWYWYWYW